MPPSHSKPHGQVSEFQQVLFLPAQQLPDAASNSHVNSTLKTNFDIFRDRNRKRVEAYASQYLAGNSSTKGKRWIVPRRHRERYLSFASDELKRLYRRFSMVRVIFPASARFLAAAAPARFGGRE